MAITKHKNSNLNKCLTEAHQFISALHRQFWLGAVIASASNFQKMVKGQLKSGEKMFVVRVEHFVKARDFATALTDRYFSEHEIFPKNLTKKEAEKILKRSLFFNGLEGQYESGYFDSSYEEGTRYNEIYSDALEWVKSKYEWLS